MVVKKAMKKFHLQLSMFRVLHEFGVEKQKQTQEREKGEGGRRESSNLTQDSGIGLANSCGKRDQKGQLIREGTESSNRKESRSLSTVISSFTELTDKGSLN